MTTNALAEQLRRFIYDPAEERLGIMRQINNFPSYVEVESRVPADDFLEALLAVIEALGKRGDSREEILAAARNGFESSGAEAVDIVPYLDGVMWLQNEEDPEDAYCIAMRSALTEIMMYVDDMSNSK